MSTIEERVVGMRFDSSKLTSGIKPAVDGLDKLKSSLKLDGATKALDELDSAGKKFSLANVGTAAEGVSLKFVALATIGITALSNIVNKAVNAGQRIMSSLTIDPIKAGLDEYELKMGSIQTILANTARYNTGLPEVVASLDELNTYADKTIYNFGDMTKNIGLFTNAGIGIKDATSLIKGFSNESAASGVTASNAASAAYQLSQALSAGTIRLIDWRSLTNVGLGNKNMQGGIIEIAEAMGTLSDKGITATEIQGDFNGSLEKNWLSADVMSNYLKIMSGDMDETAQSALGLSDAQIVAFQKQQATAEEAATKVRTYTQLLGTMRESVGSGWSQSFDIIIGDFIEATDLFTSVNDTLGGMVGAASDARNKILQDWSDNGGRAAAIELIASAFNSLMAIITPVKAAFTNIFPPVTGAQLADITKKIRDFIVGLKPTAPALTNIFRTAKGFFALIDIGVMIISGFIGVIAKLIGRVSKGTGGFLEFTGGIGTFIVKIRDAIKAGDGLEQFFNKISFVLQFAMSIIMSFIGMLGVLFQSSADVAKGGLDSWADRVQARFEALGGVLAWFTQGIELLKTVGKAVADFFAPLARTVGGFVSDLGSAIKDSFSSSNFSSVLDFLNTGLLAGIGLMLYKFIGKMKGMFNKAAPTDGLMTTIKGVFGQLGDTLSALQGQVKAKTLMYIAGAVAILTLSVIALSMIDTGKLFIALGAITVMFTQLGLAMAAFEKGFTTEGAAKLVLISAAMIGMATAMLIFSAAVAVLSSLDWNELARGLVGMAVGLAIMVVAMKGMSKVGPGAIVGAVAMTIAAIGIAILAGALKLMGMLSWVEIAKSMVTLGVALGLLAVGLTLMLGSLPGAAALVIAAVGIAVLAGALKIFATLSWDDIGRAMTLLGGTLAILAIGLTLMVAALPGAAALVVASVGLAVIAGVLHLFALINPDQIGNVMIILGGTLGILALGLTLMIAAMPGALALIVAAGALAILAPVLLVLGAMSWEEIWTGLGALALVLGVIAIAGYALIPALPGIIGLGVAVAFLGIGVLAAGIGVAMFAVGLTALSVAGGAAITVLIAAVTGLAGLIPFVAEQIGLGLIAIATVIGTNGPTIVVAITAILLALIQAIINVIPQLVQAGIILIMSLVNALIILIPALVDAGMRIVIGILDGVARNIGKVVEKGTDIVVNFIAGIGKAIPRIAQSAAELIINFVNGIANAIRNNTAAMNAAGSNLAGAIVDGMTSGIRNGISTVVNAAKDMAKKALNAAKDFLGIKSPSREFKAVGKFSTQGLANGLIEYSSISEKAAGKLGSNTLSVLKKSMADAGELMSQGGMDSRPTIRPVLDLSAIKKDAGLIGGIVGGQSLAVDGATARANAISAKYGEYQQAMADNAGPTTEVSLTQNNYSPTALPAAEIYRQSKNQMSILKGELEKHA